VSDWTGVRSVESAKHPQDLAMPGPIGAWGDALLEAVRSGEAKEEAIDRKVLRILKLAARVGALEGFSKPAEVPQVDGIAFSRTASAEGSVLLTNHDELPWSAPQRVAVIGHNARDARTQGGGSATVIPASVVSPLEGIRRALPDAQVTYSIGAVVQEGVAELPLATMTNPVNGRPGARVRFLAADGLELYAENRFSSALVYLGGNAPIGDTAVFEFHTTYTPAESGDILLGFATVGRGRIFADGNLLREETAVPVGDDLGAALLSPPSISTPLSVTAGQAIDLRVELDVIHIDGGLEALSITIGVEPDRSDPQALIDEAVAAARDAEVAIVVVGTNSKVESEGYDRTSLALPGRQDDLVRAVAAANPHTVVVVNAGSPVLLPWRDDVAAVLVTYFGGQEYGNALADVLLGSVEPGGRLPTTWPRAESDVPVIDVTPVDGVLRYDEGVHIGYRAWLKAGIEPAYSFGHGLGYTTWELSDLRANDPISVALTVRNTGSRAGKHVVQVYAERPETAVDRPVRWLAGFAVVRLEAGQAREITVHLHNHTFDHWNDGWTTEPGTFTLRAGSSVSDLALSTELEIR
jgi:beta-glucosidase